MEGTYQQTPWKRVRGELLEMARVGVLNFGYEGVDNACARYEFHIKMFTLKAVLQTEEDYGVPNSVRMFTGENAIEECIEWTTERLIELYETVSARTAPYKAGYENYQRALKGEVQ